MFLYTFILALGQIFLKLGMSAISGIAVPNAKEALPLFLAMVRSPYLLAGTALLAGSFFLWLVILSWYKLGLVFPLTALTYIFVSLLSYFMLGDKLLPQNYLGIALIACGVFFLLYR